jgi:hypothetical protein
MVDHLFIYRFINLHRISDPHYIHHLSHSLVAHSEKGRQRFYPHSWYRLLQGAFCIYQSVLYTSKVESCTPYFIPQRDERYLHTILSILLTLLRTSLSKYCSNFVHYQLRYTQCRKMTPVFVARVVRYIMKAIDPVAGL